MKLPVVKKLLSTIILLDLCDRVIMDRETNMDPQFRLQLRARLMQA
jgi:hypothetical protein